MSLEYVKYFNLFGEEVAQVPSILDHGNPEGQTDNEMVNVAEPGCFYMDIDSGELYKSTWENNEIKWKIVGSAEIPSFDLMNISTEGVSMDGTMFNVEYDTTAILEAVANGIKIINIKIPVKDIGEVSCVMSVIEAKDFSDFVQLSGLFAYVDEVSEKAIPNSLTIIIIDGYITAFITRCLSESDAVTPVIINIEASTYTLESGTSVLSCTASHTPEEVYQMMSDDKLFICTVQQYGGGPNGDLIVKECAVNLQLVTGSGFLKAVFCDEYTIYGDLHENRWYAELNIGGGGSAEGAVRYDQLQDLDKTEQERARRNIGAAAQMPVFNLSEYLSRLGYTNSLIIGDDLNFDYNPGDFNDIMYAAENGPIQIIINAQYNGTTFTASFVVTRGAVRSNNSDEFMSSQSICGLATTNGFHMLFYMYNEGSICHLGIIPLVVSTDLQSALGDISTALDSIIAMQEELIGGESA